MKIDKSIFGLRFGGNVELYPAQEELSAFLESPKQPNRQEVQGNDLATHTKILEAILAFEHALLVDANSLDYREMIFYRVLSHSGFFNTTLKSEVEYFKFHARSVLTLDFRKPEAFIKAAQEEMGLLNPKKKGDAAKQLRLRSMVSEREKALEALKKHRTALTDELRHIARYVRDNLVKIEKLCEDSIAILVDPDIAIREENRIIGDIKAFIKEKLKNELHQSTITKQRLEDAKKGVDAVTKEVSVLVRKDIDALTRLYEAIYDHSRKFVLEINALLEELNGKKGQDLEESGKLFAQLEQAVVSLISDFHFEPEAAETHTETGYKHILLEKRKEMLDNIFGLILRERRLRSDRRADGDRRKFTDPSLTGPERRVGKDRRARRNRRNT